MYQVEFVKVELIGFSTFENVSNRQNLSYQMTLKSLVFSAWLVFSLACFVGKKIYYKTIEAKQKKKQNESKLNGKIQNQIVCDRKFYYE